MVRKLKNLFAAIRGVLILRNLLAVLCAAALIAVTVKAVRIEAKIGQVRQADAYYEQRRLIPAEAAYAAALSDTVVRYREGHIRERLAGLVPVTRLREELLKTKSEMLTASENGDFEAFLLAYETYDGFDRLSSEGEFAAEYRELNERYELTATAASGFADFRASFEQALASNLENESYADESAKWKLLQIPAAFFANADSGTLSASEGQNAADFESVKTEKLNALLQDYDRRKLKKLAAAGRYADMLNEAESTIAAYGQRGFEAPWVPDQAEKTADTVLRKDLDAEAYPAFAAHAREFADFAAQTGPGSGLVSWIEARVDGLMNRARSLVADNRFEEAIALYKALSGYSDTAEEIAQAENAWTEAEPLRILRAADPSHTYSLAISGKNRFGADLYTAALDENGTLYFGTKDGSGTSVFTGPQMLTGLDVLRLDIEESLSTESSPVILAESESASRRAVYTALQLRDSSFVQMFQIDADGYAIENGGRTLRADRPADAEEDGQTAVYERYGDVFVFDMFEGGTLEIGGENPAGHAGRKVRTLLTVVESGSGQALALAADGSDILLRGGFDFEPGTYAVTGTFRGEYARIAVDDPAASGGSALPPESPTNAETGGTDFPEGGEAAEDPSAAVPNPGPDTAEDLPGDSGAGEAPEDPAASESPAAPNDSAVPNTPAYRSVPVFEVDAVAPGA
ncbi:hypothetical protein [Saccharibacillus alkalitolerans]|uniref:Uncharacterized protein n=1 Tax=Saccharibacillus alkalitolerans TaxID=2705290 RepID=A0ABX0FEE8_9BACL|nr:hypothetical protein [Saccharibacillus alkalitolerans]NGZ78027.1 hypothetical protein [Saccharibacillus alkalitolerans]